MCKCIWRLGPALVIFSSCSLLHFLSHGISLNLKLTRAARLPGLVRPGLPVGIPPTQSWVAGTFPYCQPLCGPENLNSCTSCAFIYWALVPGPRGAFFEIKLWVGPWPLVCGTHGLWVGPWPPLCGTHRLCPVHIHL